MLEQYHCITKSNVFIFFRDYSVFSNAFLQDFRPSEVYTCEFLLDNTQMGFLVADGDKNLVLYMYQPESRESFGGIIVVSCNILLLNFVPLFLS